MTQEELQAENAELRRQVAALKDALEGASQERDTLRSALGQIPVPFLVLRGKDLVMDLANQPGLDNLGRRDDDLGKPLREVLPELAGQGFFELLDGVLTTGETFVGRDMPVDLNRNGTGVLERRWYTFHYAAYRGSDGELAGVVCHGTDVTEEVIARQEAQALDARMRTFFVLAENAPDGITVTEEGRIVYANPAFRRMLGLGEEGIGRLHAELLAEESRETFQEVRSRQSAEGTWQGTLTYRRSDGSPFLGQVSSFAIPREGGGTSSEGCIVRDRTAELRHAVHEQVIAAQEREILELSTPLMPLAEGLVVMPLVGTINRARAALIMETLLQGITTQQAQVAILDITGVEVVDTHVANALLKTAQAASLLGTEVVLTGIKPDVARTLVAIEADLGRVKTHGTLQSAVAYAMGKSARRAP